MMRHTRAAGTAAALCLAAAGVAAGQAPGAAPAEEPAVLETPTGTLHGTLLLPAGRGPHPVVLLISGSGPTDRDGNTVGMGPNHGLRKLAEGLAGRGIASLRYDKRGIAASQGAGVREDELRFDTYVDDAAGWLRKLRGDPRFSTVTVAGHSEGSLIGMRAAAAVGADAFVSLAGAGRAAGAVLREQLRPALPAPLFARADSILRELEAGRTVAGAPPELFALFRPSVQPYMISWLRYDPAAEVAKLAVPVLVVQGSTDVQVTVADAGALHRAAPGSRLLVLEGMNHVLKAVPDDRARQVASYSDPTLPLAPRLVDEVAAFVRAARRR